MLKLMRAVLILTLLLGGHSVYAADTASFGELLSGGYFHPGLQINGEYTDNYFLTPDNEESAWITKISPSFWLSIPGSRLQRVAPISSHNSAGGQGVTRFQDEGFTGLQSALFYRADIVTVDNYSADDSIRQTAQGVLQYNFPSGLAFEVSDVYVDDYESYAEGDDNENDEYRSNLVNLIGYYRPNEKFKFRLGYSHYLINYKSDDDSDMEHADDQLSAYVFYRVLPKTEAFLQYDHISVQYDSGPLSDNSEQHFYAGLKFDDRALIKGHVKLGYGLIDTDQSAANSYRDMIGEAMLSYALGERSTVSMHALRRVDVSDGALFQNILHDECGIAFKHKLNAKLDVTLRAVLGWNERRIDSDLNGYQDDTLNAGVKVAYEARKWLIFGAGYRFTNVDSDLPDSEYTENSWSANMAINF